MERKYEIWQPTLSHSDDIVMHVFFPSIRIGRNFRVAVKMWMV